MVGEVHIIFGAHLMNGNVLVTGAAGFIGRSLVHQLVDRGYKVTGLDNFRFSNTHQIPRHQWIDWVQGDTRDFDLMSKLVARADAIVHLAAPSSFLMHEENDLEACSFTMMGFKTLMEAAKKHGHKRVVWASTSAVYEEWQKPPRVPFHEALPINPPDSKAGCKWWCEQEAERYRARYGIEYVAFRPFSVYGVGEHTKLGYANVTSLFTWAMMAGIQPVIWGDGSQTRDFIFVDDVARAFVMALEKPTIPSGAYNLGVGIEHTFNDVVAIASRELQFDAHPQYVDFELQIYALRLWADVEKAKKILGFKPRVTLEEGIARIIEATNELPQADKDQLNLGMQQMYFETLPR